VITSDGHAVFIAEEGGRRQVYDVAPGASPTLAVRVGQHIEATYEPQRLFAATGDVLTGSTLFQAAKGRTPDDVAADPTGNEWPVSALVLQEPDGDVHELGSFNIDDVRASGVPRWSSRR